MWSLDSCEWYVNGSPLVRLLAREIYKARFDSESEPGILWCSDSNASIDIIDLARQIKSLCAL